MMMFGRLLLAAALSLAALPASAQTRPKVVATFSILGDLVAEVAGDQRRPRRPGRRRHRRPHLPAQADRRAHARRRRRRMVSNGLGFEGWIDRLAEAAPFKGRPIVATTGVPTLEAPRRGHGHTHGPDPHCWQDVGRARRYVANIAAGLAEADPANAADYRERAPALRPAPRRARPVDQGGDRQGAGRPAQGHHRPRLVPLLRRGLWRAVPGAARLQHRQRAVGPGRGGADPPGARAEDQGAVRREHDQSRPGRPDRPRSRAPWSARVSTATPCRRPAARRRPTRR